MAVPVKRIIKTSGDLQKRRFYIHEYIRNHHLEEFFDFLFAQVLCNRPEEPMMFLVQLLDDCMLFRSGHLSPPSLFDQKHTDQIFKSLDPKGIGEITLKNYTTAMSSMGIKNYNLSPQLTAQGNVSKRVFDAETKKSLTEILARIVGC